MKWFRIAAEQGLDRSQINIGGLYYYGYGVPQDRVEAAKWYRKAAEQGNKEAKDCLKWAEPAVFQVKQRLC